MILFNKKAFHCGNDAGFSLVEVLIAIALLALSFAVLTDSMGQSLAREAHLSERQMARRVALNAIALWEKTGTVEGQSHRYNWQISLDAPPMGDGPYKLASARTDVHWEGGQFSLNSHHLVRGDGL